MMLVTIGICTRYSRHEATFAAIRLGDWLQRQGREVSIFTMTDRPPAVDPRWDKRLVRNKTFTEWAAECSYIVWTAVPHLPQLTWAKAQRKKTILVVLWHELFPDARPILPRFDVVLCPNCASHEFVSNWGVRNTLCLPWMCGFPIHRKPSGYQITEPRIILPLWDGIARRTEMTALDIVGRAMYRTPSTRFTIVYNASTICSAGNRRVRQLRKWFGDRLTVIRGGLPHERPFLFQEHDLTLWPTHFESTCMVGLGSIELGTPVMGFNFRPTNEILNEHNGIAIPCFERMNDLGLPRVVPDYEMMDELLHQAVTDPSYLRYLQTTVSDGLDTRHELFNSQLSRAFS